MGIGYKKTLNISYKFICIFSPFTLPTFLFVAGSLSKTLQVFYPNIYAYVKGVECLSCTANFSYG